MFCSRCFYYYFFFNREIFEMRRPIGAKFYKMISTGPYLITPVQNFLGPSLQKILGTKSMQNFARFRSTSKFGSEYLRNG